MSEHNVNSSVFLPRGAFDSFVLDVTFREAAEPPVLKDLDALIETWVALGAAGAFCLAEVTPRQSTMAVEERKRSSALQSEWRIMVKQTDPRCLRVLRNALVAFSQTSHPIERVQIKTPVLRDGTPPLEAEPVTPQSQGVAYPEASRRLGFPVVRKVPSSYRSNRRVLIELKMPHSDATIDAISSVVDRWVQIGLGGFPMEEADLDTGNCAIFEGDTSAFDEYTLESVINMFGASEAAWNPLLNALDSSSQGDSQIVRVVIH